MIASVIGQSDLTVIANLVAGMEVLQVGCYQGHDTAALAHVAARVVTIGQHQGLDHIGFRDQISMWAVIQRFYAVADRTLIFQGDPGYLLSTFIPGQFDVAVLDLFALNEAVPNMYPALLAPLAARVIVIPTRYQDWPGWSVLMKDLGYTCEQAGRVWVFDRAPVAAQAETKEGD